MEKKWVLKSLDELFNVKSSKRVHKKDWKKSGIPFYRAREVVKLAQNGTVDNELFISEELYQEFTKEKNIPKEGDIIISAVGTLGQCYLVKKSDKFYFKDASVLWFEKKSDVNERYIDYAFKSDSILKQVHDKSMGATVGTLTISRAKIIKIPIPPLEEQQVIVAKLDQAFTAIDQAKANIEKNIANAKELFQSKLNQIFSQKGDGWEIKNIRDIAIVTAGQSPEGKYYNENGVGLPFYQGKKEFTEKYIGEAKVWTEKITKEALEGDVLMSVRAPVGPINFATQKCCIGRGLASIRVKENFDKDFLFYYFKNIENQLTGNTGAVFNSINKSQIEQIQIAYPDIVEQRNVVSKVNKLQEQTNLLVSKYQQKLANLEELKKSILEKAFKGELV